MINSRYLNQTAINFFCVSVFIFTLSTFVFTQSTITGIVYDKQRNALPDIDIELLNDLYQAIRRTKTDNVGRYEFGGLRNGRYFIRVYAFRYDLEDQTEELEINTQNIRGGEGSGTFIKDFYLLPRKGGLAESELGIIFAQEVPSDAKKLYEQAVNELSKKRSDSAIKLLNEAIKIFPDYFNALYRIGKELWLKQRFEEAAHFLFKAAQINPKSAATLYYLGSSLHKLGKDYNKAALASLNQAFILAPSSIQTLYLLGKIQREEGKFAEAEKNLLQAKKLSGGGIPEIHIELAQLYGNDLKKFKEAADELELYLKASKVSESEEKNVRKVINSLREKAKTQNNRN